MFLELTSNAKFHTVLHKSHRCPPAILCTCTCCSLPQSHGAAVPTDGRIAWQPGVVVLLLTCTLSAFILIMQLSSWYLPRFICTTSSLALTVATSISLKAQGLLAHPWLLCRAPTAASGPVQKEGRVQHFSANYKGTLLGRISSSEAVTGVIVAINNPHTTQHTQKGLLSILRHEPAPALCSFVFVLCWGQAMAHRVLWASAAASPATLLALERGCLGERWGLVLPVPQLCCWQPAEPAGSSQGGESCAEQQCCLEHPVALWAPARLRVAFS